MLMHLELTRCNPRFLSSELRERSENLGHEERKNIQYKFIDFTMEFFLRS